MEYVRFSPYNAEIILETLKLYLHFLSFFEHLSDTDGLNSSLWEVGSRLYCIVSAMGVDDLATQWALV